MGGAEAGLEPKALRWGCREAGLSSYVYLGQGVLGGIWKAFQCGGKGREEGLLGGLVTGCKSVPGLCPAGALQAGQEVPGEDGPQHSHAAVLHRSQG